MINTRIKALDFLSQLGKEKVYGYTVENRTIGDIIDDLLGFQVLTPSITKGTIDAGIAAETRSIQIDGDSILTALLKLRDTVGGYIDVDNDLQLNWAASTGEDKGQQIRYGKNILGILRKIGYSSLVNRVYAYGQGQGTARIKLSDADGQEEDYVEDTDSQSTWGGVYARTFVDRTITHPDTLLAWANQLKELYKDPPISYRVDSVDLSQHEFSFEELMLGSTVRVIDERLGLDVETTVVKIEHPDMDNPLHMVVELSTVTKDITDTLTDLFSTQQLEQHLATVIGAGQVSVLGDFRVSDWLSGESTNISGDNIRTGTIESSNWGASEGSQFNLDDGTFRLGGSDSPALEWDGETLTVTGIGGFLEEGEAAADVNSHATKISGGKIVTGSITALQIAAGTITADKLAVSYIQVSGAAADVNAGATTISGGKITTNSLDANVIKASSLQVSLNLTTGGYIKSNNFVSGSSGWQIDYAGNAEFNNVIVRGTIKNTTLDSGNTLIVSGTISAGGGAVYLNTAGLNINTAGGTTFCRFINGAYYGYIYLSSGGSLVLETSSSYIDLNDATRVSGSALYPISTTPTLGTASYPWYIAYLSYVYLSGHMLPKTTYTYDLGNSSYSFDVGWISVVRAIGVAATAPGTGYVGSPTNYYEYVRAKNLVDAGCPVPRIKNHIDKINNIRTVKRSLTPDDVKREGMGSRALQRVLASSDGEIDDLDISSFDDELLSIPSQEDWDEAALDYAERLSLAKETGMKESDVPIYEPKAGWVVNDVVLELVFAMQELVKRIEALESTNV